jgi:hypothetical protein
VVAAGQPALALLVGLLDKAIAADASPRGAKDGYDASLIWRPAIERNDSVGRGDLKNALVDAIGGAASQLIDAGTATVKDVIEELAHGRWLIFRRLILNLLTTRGADAAAPVGQHLTDPGIVRDDHLGREYLLLARAAQARLGQRDRHRLLALIRQGPDTDSWIAQYARYNDEEPSPDRVRVYVETWQRDRFAAIEQVLPGDLRARYQVLVAEHREAPDPAFPPAPTFSVWSEDSPVSAEELTAMPADSLVEFLRTWQPPRDGRRRDRASLRGVLNSAIRHDAPRRSADAGRFIGLDPEHVTPVIEGLWQATADKAALD